MFYNVIVNDWGETTYVPTMLGNLLLAIVLLGLLIAAAIFSQKNSSKQSKKPSAKQLAFCAAAIALATVLSNIKIFNFPTGGSITLLSMLVIVLPGYWFGLSAGIMTSVAYGVLQLLIDPYVLYPMQLVVDYILAFGALGLSGLFSNAKYGLLKGYIVGILGRYVFAVISGWIFFGSYAWEGWGAFTYSLVYNGIYIFAEAAITVIILMIPSVKNALANVKKLAET